MSGRAAAIAAQIGPEVRTRLRSFSTLAALLFALVGSILWIPDPKGKASSLSWRLADGRVQAPIYDSAYIGFAAAALIAILVALVGFYLVAGSVRRDRERGVGAILAATPLSKSEYLLGKFAAHVAYLLVVTGLVLTAALTAWLRFGSGPFDAFAFCVPFFLLSLPAIVVTASFAVLFDVAPGLSGRAGYVVWFFVFSFLLVAIPLASAGGGSAAGKLHRFPVIDPAGAATQAWMARQTVPGATGYSTGLEIRDEAFERVPWRGVDVTPKLIGGRAVSLLVSLVPLALAVFLFDRFDPARRRLRAPQPTFSRRLIARFGRREPVENGEFLGDSASAGVVRERVAARPSAAAAVLAETRMIWDGASWLKWPLAASAVLGAFFPQAGGIGLFLLMIPAVSEVAAREDLAGTRALVFSQPGVPRSAVLWKAASVSLFLLPFAAPLAIRVALGSPLRGLAVVGGVFFAAFAAVGLGSLSSGGKLFSGIFLVLWYMGVSGLPAADFAGVLSQAPVPVYSAFYLLGGAALLAAAAMRERLRRA